jgi:hypothetical protein
MTDEDDKEATRIIARPGPKQVPFRVEPAVAPAAPAVPEPRPEVRGEVRGEVRPVPARPAVIVPPVGRPAVMVPPGGPARAGRSPLVAPPVVALPGAATPPTPVQPQPVVPAAAVTPPPVVAVPVAPAPAAPIVPATVDPVVGWVVVVKGPGRGAALALHAGRNSLGAALGEDLRLAFGDPAIAASGHAFLAYDEEARVFFIEDGKKKELVRVNGRMLTETRPLAAGDEIRVGATTLRFVAFCGPDFDWAQPDAPASTPAEAPALPPVETPNGAGEGI